MLSLYHRLETLARAVNIFLNFWTNENLKCEKLFFDRIKFAWVLGPWKLNKYGVSHHI